ncbi:hypothetical protein B0H67DRAFT_245306 [Lasiosphaeris hirsuta]|uniref:Uncharacterized protein n=1 Tax=Lasiosphaeris hirsuta TaxID=260670 RepID=A0AA40DXU5_9PEZI|nr:hypothetical protein B0H67DRAFT_245306 [Lasiosphaeris hirsuta]
MLLVTCLQGVAACGRCRFAVLVNQTLSPGLSFDEADIAGHDGIYEGGRNWAEARPSMEWVCYLGGSGTYIIRSVSTQRPRYGGLAVGCLGQHLAGKRAVVRLLYEGQGDRGNQLQNDDNKGGIDEVTGPFILEKAINASICRQSLDRYGMLQAILYCAAARIRSDKASRTAGASEAGSQRRLRRGRRSMSRSHGTLQSMFDSAIRADIDQWACGSGEAVLASCERTEGTRQPQDDPFTV